MFNELFNPTLKLECESFTSSPAAWSGTFALSDTAHG